MSLGLQRWIGSPLLGRSWLLWNLRRTYAQMPQDGIFHRAVCRKKSSAWSRRTFVNKTLGGSTVRYSKRLWDQRFWSRQNTSNNRHTESVQSIIVGCHRTKCCAGHRVSMNHDTRVLTSTTEKPCGLQTCDPSRMELPHRSMAPENWTNCCFISISSMKTLQWDCECVTCTSVRARKFESVLYLRVPKQVGGNYCCNKEFCSIRQNVVAMQPFVFVSVKIDLIRHSFAVLVPSSFQKQSCVFFGAHTSLFWTPNRPVVLCVFVWELCSQIRASRVCVVNIARNDQVTCVWTMSSTFTARLHPKMFCLVHGAMFSVFFQSNELKCRFELAVVRILTESDVVFCGVTSWYECQRYFVWLCVVALFMCNRLSQPLLIPRHQMACRN